MPGNLVKAFLALAVLASAWLLAGCAGEETRPTTANPTVVPTMVAAGTDSHASTIASTPESVPTVSVPVPTVGFLPTTAPSRPVSSSAISISPDGALVAAVNPDSDSITLVDTMTLEVIEEIPVGDDPRTLSFTPDSKAVLVANRGSANVTIVEVADPQRLVQVPVGPMPYGVVTDGRYAFVAEFALGNLAVIDLSDNALVKRLPVGPFPAGLALLPKAEDDVRGSLVFVTHFFSGQVTVVDLETLSIVARASTGVGTNLSQFLVVGPSGARAYLPQTRANATNTAMTFDTTVFPVVNVLDLAGFSLLDRDRITIDTADQPTSIPFAAALSPDENRMFVVHAGSDNVSVIDLANNQGLANIDVGANPRGIAITPDGLNLFVNNVLDGTMSVIDANAFEVTNSIELTTIPLPPEVLRGKRIFNSAASPALTNDNWISCASCHFDGGTDGRTWQGFPDGPRNTPALFGVGQTLPIHWSGDLDELQDVELTIRNIQFGTGLVPGEARDSLGPSHAGLSLGLDALAAYLNTIEVPPSPYSSDSAAVKLGEDRFNALGCQTCHAPPLFTDLRLHDVGTGDSDKEKNSHGRDTTFDTPSLRGVWMTAPYFHDGSAATLEEVFRTGSNHNIFGKLVSDEELEALIAYIQALP